jgi:hypothetical protein
MTAGARALVWRSLSVARFGVRAGGRRDPFPGLVDIIFIIDLRNIVSGRDREASPAMPEPPAAGSRATNISLQPFRSPHGLLSSANGRLNVEVRHRAPPLDLERQPLGGFVRRGLLRTLSRRHAHTRHDPPPADEQAHPARESAAAGALCGCHLFAVLIRCPAGGALPVVARGGWP